MNPLGPTERPLQKTVEQTRRPTPEITTHSQKRAPSLTLGGSDRLLSSGEILDGHYEVTALLGAGGMAEVYLGFDRWLKRQVAIKATTYELRAHLEREAQALASFRHPGLVTAHAYGRHKRVPYLVLEYLAGPSLTHRLVERGDEPFSIDESLRLVVGISEALAPLHERGLVHCDLKPGNVMCTDTRVVLIDLGLVWDPSSEVRDSRLSGSPPFMAPEVMLGRVRPDQAHLIDIYALGMLLYTLIAGGTPFPGDDVGSIMARQLAQEAEPLSARRSDLPPCLSDIVASMIHRDPAQRPRNVTAVRDALLGIPRRGARRA